MNNNHHWYVLKTHMNNEDSVAKTLKEHVVTFSLEEKIADILVLKNYKIVESEEYHASSEKLPEKSFRSTKKSQWLHLRNGNYMKVRIQEEKPYRGMIFLHMVSDLKLFYNICTWVSGTSFLGGNKNPSVISDFDFENMSKNYINQKIPDLQQYLLDKHLNDLTINIKRENKYQSKKVKDGSSKIEAFEVIAEDDVNKLFHLDQTMLENDFRVGVSSVIKADEESIKTTTDQFDILIAPQESIEKLNDLSVLNQQHVIKPAKELTKKIVNQIAVSESEDIVEEKDYPPILFKVEQSVFLIKLNMEGVVKEIRQKKNEVVVQIEMFGRSQSITVDPNDIKTIET